MPFPYTNIRVTSRKVRPSLSVVGLRSRVEQCQLLHPRPCPAGWWLRGPIDRLGCAVFVPGVSGFPGPLEVQAGVQIQQKRAIRTDMAVHQGREPSEILRRQALFPGRSTQDPLNHQRVDEDQAVL
jgi:hypothetical protein